jgi:hypothetical protein
MVDQQEEHALVTIRLLAKGIVEMRRLVADGAIVRQDEMPAPLRSGLERLSRHCLLDGVEDFGANVHVLMALACKPIGEWEVPCFSEPFSHARAILIDSNLGVPTDDCVEIGNISSEMDAYENIHHRRLREAVRSQGKRANEVYTLVRERIIRHPVENQKELLKFLLDSGLTKIADVYRSWLRVIPMSAIHPDGKVRICAGCGGLLYPTRDISRFPNGSCRVRACVEVASVSRVKRVLDDPNEWRVAANDVLASWVGPGLPEIKLYDDLRSLGLKVELFPGQDATDVGIPYELGIDVKSYSCPVTLGGRLTRSIGGLAEFDRRIIAVPDTKVARHRGYLDDLKRHYRGKLSVEFLTVSQTVRNLSS